jgi:hypothetical protein
VRVGARRRGPTRARAPPRPPPRGSATGSSAPGVPSPFAHFQSAPRSPKSRRNRTQALGRRGPREGGESLEQPRVACPVQDRSLHPVYTIAPDGVPTQPSRPGAGCRRRRCGVGTRLLALRARPASVRGQISGRAAEAQVLRTEMRSRR